MDKHSQFVVNHPGNIDVNEFCDERGCLYPIEGFDDVPFEIKRVFWIKNVPEKAERANHGHEKTQQVIFCLSGRFEVWITGYGFFSLSGVHPRGVYIPPGYVITLRNFTPDAVCLVLASEHYYLEDFMYAEAMNEHPFFELNTIPA